MFLHKSLDASLLYFRPTCKIFLPVETPRFASLFFFSIKERTDHR